MAQEIKNNNNLDSNAEHDKYQDLKLPQQLSKTEQLKLPKFDVKAEVAQAIELARKFNRTPYKQKKEKISEEVVKEYNSFRSDIAKKNFRFNLTNSRLGTAFTESILKYSETSQQKINHLQNVDIKKNATTLLKQSSSDETVQSFIINKVDKLSADDFMQLSTEALQIKAVSKMEVRELNICVHLAKTEKVEKTINTKLEELKPKVDPKMQKELEEFRKDWTGSEDFSTNLISEVDSGKDKFCTKQELKDFIETTPNRFKKAFIKAVLLNYKEISAMSKDQNSTVGLSAKDLSSMNATILEKILNDYSDITAGRPVQDRSGLERLERIKDLNKFDFKKALKGVDKNNDGYYTKKELSNAIQDRNVKGIDAAVISSLHQYCSEIMQLSNDEWGKEDFGITIKDINKIEDNQSLAKEFKYILRENQEKVFQTADSLFGDYGKPSINAYDQSPIGNCYILATIGAIAEMRPGLISGTLQLKDEKTISVNLKGDLKGAFEVSTPTDGELAKYSAVSKGYGYWPIILEKAVGTYTKDYLNKGESLYDLTEQGGSPKAVIELLTGNQAGIYVLSRQPLEKISKHLVNLIENKKIAVLGTASNEGRNYLDNTNIRTNHAFSLIDYDAVTGLFTIIEPNKFGEKTKRAGDGKMEMTAKEIKKYFHQIDFETDRALLYGRKDIEE